MKKKDLTLARIKNTSFPILYERLLLSKDITSSDYFKALSIAIIFLNSDAEAIRKLGYRIILIYCNQTHDYKPLYEIAINMGFIPVSKLIESFKEYSSYESIFTEINAAFSELFRENAIYKSEQQQELNDFYLANNENTVSIIAPTSYGKTDLILSTLSINVNRNICIITPTKSLLTQTKMRIMNAKISWIHKVITHPEMYNESENNIVAVLTQERLLRLLKMHPTLSFNYVIVDEAHSLLNNDERNRLLASVLIILEKRNSETIFKFLTPFLCDSDNIQIRFADIQMSSFSVSEYIKTEKFYIYDERETKQLIFYDQFVDDFFVVKQLNSSDVEFIIDNCANKNIVYLNKPKDIELFTKRLAQKLPIIESETINVACKNLKEFIHPQYDLMDCLKKGIIYHHGSVPDSIRIYIEYLFSTLPEIRYVTTSSTLLEGVNLPADRMFILDNKKGRSNLSPSSFKNLIGRICRFNEIFKIGSSDLQKLEPNVFLVVGNYYSKNANAKKFLSQCMKIDKTISDNRYESPKIFITRLLGGLFYIYSVIPS
ncbi:MAG: DEAD/DEAH box helicase [Erysipelotrichia bacterium]|nr:DEAD/DEAH box helicase [Erysipelotrichia bacterium]